MNIPTATDPASAQPAESAITISDRGYDACPQCGAVATYTIRHLSGPLGPSTEEEVRCPNCGYYSSTGEDETEIAPGNGVYVIAYRDGPTLKGPLAYPFDDSDVDWFRGYIRDTPHIDEERSGLARWVDGALRWEVAGSEGISNPEAACEEGDYLDPRVQDFIPF